MANKLTFSYLTVFGFIHFFTISFTYTDALASEQVQESRGYGHQWALRYLSIYHPDFNQIRIETTGITNFSRNTQIFDSSGNILKTVIQADGSDNRMLFSALASLLIGIEEPVVNKTALQALEAAWYWDAMAMENPAVFDQLEYRSETGKDATIAFETEAFWKYRLLMHQHGGRLGLWKAITRNPEIIECLHPQTPQPFESRLALLELRDFKLSPVLSLERSKIRLNHLESFRLLHHQVTGASIWSPIHQIPSSTLQNPQFLNEVKTRIFTIKSLLPALNPLFLNSFQSLGVCYERLIEDDERGFQHALQRYIDDREFVQQVLLEIQQRKREQTQNEKASVNIDTDGF